MYALLLLFACWSASALATERLYYEIDNAEEYFENFIIEYSKSYTTEKEKAHRFEIFKINLEKVNRLNEENHHAVYGVTQFMDLSEEEMIKSHTGLGVGEEDDLCEIITDDDIKDDPDVPESFDWRNLSVVTRVKNQGGCGSCWAFSSIAQLESQYAIKNFRKHVELSEQQVIDCDRISDGCCGGLMSTAFKALMKTGGVMLSKDYPYLLYKDNCQSVADRFVTRVTGCFSYRLESQEKVKQLLYQHGPISIAIKAHGFRVYKNGIISDDICSQGGLNHAVLLVGYGSEKNVPYWIVKNSWGEKFGEAGYFRMPRGANAHSCGMMNEWMTTAVIE